jgi:small GTP-binding protein
MEHTPRANRIHIGIYGRCNSGKSSLVNALTGQQAAVVSDVAGTTTDAVNKSMELPGLGAVTFIDTAGFDDTGELGPQRLDRTRKAADRTDVALIVHAGGATDIEREWIGRFGERNIPVVLVRNKADLLADGTAELATLRTETGIDPIAVSARTGQGIERLIAAIAEAGRRFPSREDSSERATW